VTRILLVEDTEDNRQIVRDLLSAKGYAVISARSGPEALAMITRQAPHLVLLDVMMPGMSGYEVCAAIRANPQTQILPVIMVTALDAKEARIKGLEAGADDFLTKPINQQELIARVRSLIRIKTLYDEIEARKVELAAWNSVLEERVQREVAEVERLSRLKRFFSPQVAQLITSGDAEDPLRSHRAEIAVVFVDLRGYTTFSEMVDPEEVMSVLRDYHEQMGSLIMQFEGTVERFAGDAIMIFFGDPLPIPNPAEKAVQMALAMHDRFRERAEKWRKYGYELEIGVGISLGFATLGCIGFEGRRDYGAIGTVCNQAARLCAEAKGGQTLVTQRVLDGVADVAVVESVGNLKLRGFHRAIPVSNVVKLDG
jgi:DNA-binding response OmpR family regulator